ncbi:hypothetical protein SS1G_13852 [Sclerotinia sclerotiorum 1980 UF-70]|uniref:ABC transporter n=1 Tax=Sclerotinia sclerotiorum (strain ATCC 18683 / 1980 / Ss-1) TaxID=665079 RepID=A7F8C1_SCLS1|nr:hypothetical protein SS1G_13852 [Sclerotinia sclerotiorum 1980 UF-70]EDN98992.1 hypothetical protein SS1G_13852 [Sclerotinia sclerotiorum 1980 UF-70]
MAAITQEAASLAESRASATGHSLPAVFSTSRWPLDILQLVGVAAAIGAGTARPLMPLVFGGLANKFNNFQNASTLKETVDSEVLYLLYLFIGQWVLTCTYGILLSVSAMNRSRRLRAAYLRSAVSQDTGLVSQGKVANNFATSISSIEDALSEKLGVVMQAGATVIISLVVAFVHSWQLTLVLFSTIVLLFISNFGTAALDTRFERQIQQIEENAANLAEEVFNGIRIVMACVAESQLIDKYTAILEAARIKRLRKSPILAVQFSMSYFALLASYALAFCVILSINQGTNGMRKILPIYGILSKARAASLSINKVINSTPAIDSLNPRGVVLDCVKGDIRLHDISFSYPARPSVNVLDHLNICFEAGNMTALIGTSGSGKSTIVGLLERWYEPIMGTITVDGFNINELNVKSLRGHIGLVQQEVTLFNDSIFYNVACGLYSTPFENCSEQEKRALVIQSCIEVGAHTFIESLPDGYETNVGDKGNLLSGGQKQRISIARAIISSPKILIFDEATSGLDIESERIVEAAIKKVSVGMTTIIITHKLSLIQRADQIVLLKNGSVLERGTHQSLLAMKGKYAQFYEAQELEAKIQSVDEPFKSSEIQEKHRLLRKLVIAVIPTCIVAGAVYPAQAILFGHSVSRLGQIEANIRNGENFWSLMWFVVAIAILVAFFLMGTISSIMGTTTKFHYQIEYFKSILRQDPSFFDEKPNSKGALVASLSLHTNHMQILFTVLGSLLVALVNLTSCSILALAVSWRLALVGLFGSVPIILLAGYLRVRSASAKSKALSEPLLNSAQYASEVIGAVRTVAALTMENEVCLQLDKRMRESLAVFYKNIVVTMPLFAFSESGPFLGMALIFWYGGNLLADGKLETVELWIVFLAMLSGGEGAAEFFASSSKFKSVDFSYPNSLRHLVLKEIDFIVDSGRNLAIVGPSGSGKSTIIALLEKFYKINKGSILINSSSLEKFNTEDYRRQTALVSQNTILFQGTLRDNILLGTHDLHSVDERLEAAAKDANIHEFIVSLPEGYNTQCGDKGFAFSGGQRQRIALARALSNHDSTLPRKVNLDQWISFSNPNFGILSVSNTIIISRIDPFVSAIAEAETTMKKLQTLTQASKYGNAFLARAIFRGLQGKWKIERKDPKTGLKEILGTTAFYPRYPTQLGYDSGYICKASSGEKNILDENFVYRLREMDNLIEVFGQENRLSVQPVVVGGDDVKGFGKRIYSFWMAGLCDCDYAVGPYIPYSRSSNGEGNEICGRGSTDAKGCMASQIMAVEELMAEKSIHEGDIGLLFVVGEETNGASMERASEIFQQDGLEFEAVIFGEPSEHKLVIGHKGALAYEIIAHGKDAHSSYPELRINAISILIKILTAIDEMKLPGSDKLGETTTSIGLIEGGVAMDVIPAKASATVLTRLAAGTPEEVIKRIEAIIANLGFDEGRVEVKFGHQFAPVDCDIDIDDMFRDGGEERRN